MSFARWTACPSTVTDWEVPAYVRRRSEVHIQPQGTEQPIVSALRSTIRAARREALLISAYFIPSERGVAGRQ